MAFVIAIIVIGCMAATFASLFFMYGKTKSRGIAFGVEDERLRNILLTQRLKYNQTRQKDLSVKEYIAVRRQKEKNMRIVADVLFILLIYSALGIGADGKTARRMWGLDAGISALLYEFIGV